MIVCNAVLQRKGKFYVLTGFVGKTISTRSPWKIPDASIFIIMPDFWAEL